LVKEGNQIFFQSFRMIKAKRSIMSANEEKPSSHGKL